MDGMIDARRVRSTGFASNKTIIGVGANSGFTGAGLHLTARDNIILRNLVISKVGVGEGDAINLKRTHHVWIDHCDLSSDRDRHAHPDTTAWSTSRTLVRLDHGVVDAVSTITATPA